jgi:hypothetical protein
MTRRSASLAGACLAVALACGGDSRRDEAGQADTAGGRGVGGAHFAIQLGSFADSANAARMRDSLQRLGWAAYLRAGEADGRRVWRVNVPQTGGPELARVTAFALERRGVSADSAPRPGLPMGRDTGYATRPVVIGFELVNHGSHGMSARTRWAMSPNRGAIMVVEDPAAVEADPVPNGFFLGHEEGMRNVRMDGVWDAAPAPDWRRVAFGRAYVLQGEREDSLRPEQWEALARELDLPVDSVRRAAFPASGMASAFGFAQPGVVDLANGEPRLFRGAGGWRVRWSVDGSRILVGLAPERTQDDAPARRWVAIDPQSGASLGEVPPGGRAAEVRWTEGPTIDISIEPDTAAPRTLSTSAGTIESRGGWIRVNGRIVGPGVALAATRGGRYLAALVPNPEAKQYDHREVLAVYILEY